MNISLSERLMNNLITLLIGSIPVFFLSKGAVQSFKANESLPTVFCIIGAATLIGLCLWSLQKKYMLFVRYIPAGSVYIAEAIHDAFGRGAAHYSRNWFTDEDLFFWRWSWHFAYGWCGKLLSIPLSNSVFMTVEPITENLKVLHVFYEVNLRFRGEVEQALKVLAIEKESSWQHHVRMLLFDFNAEHSIKLGTLSNPLRPEQQTAFKKLLAEYLRPSLEELGIEVENAAFHLQNDRQEIRMLMG